MMDLYAGYEEWKEWHTPFSYSVEESEYFAGQTQRHFFREADVLEIGFGSGAFLAWAKDQGARVVGVEINETSIEAARSRGITTMSPDFEKDVSSHSATFDLAVAFDVFEHYTLTEARAKILALEIMLRPGGTLLLRFPNAQSPFGLAPQHGDATHLSHLSRGVFEQLIRGTSFTITHYGRPFRPRGRSIAIRVARLLKHATQDIIAAFLGAAYSTRIPWDPVVVLVLEKSADP